MTKTSRKAVNLSAVSAFSRWLQPKSVLALCCAVLRRAGECRRESCAGWGRADETKTHG
jgi:hypothetical protein